jgi:glycosyltransferase involved in cell wall biosynthesis
MPTVSIVIPTLNRAHLVTRAIKSVLTQTYQDFEIIVVDDGSIDETEKVIQECRNKRIKYIKHKKTKGPGAARNTGIEASGGYYISFLDSDDEWRPKKIEAQIELFQKKKSKIGLIYTGVELIDQDKKITKEKWFPKYKGYVFDKSLSTNFIVSGSSTVIAQREALEKAGKFDESLPSCEDWDLWIRIARHYEFDYIPEILVNCFAHSERISSNFERVILGHKLFSKKYKEEIDKQSSNVKAKHFFYLGNHFCYYGDENLAKKYLSQAFRIYPINPKYFSALIFFTFLGSKAYTRVSSSTRPLRHKILQRIF